MMYCISVLPIFYRFVLRINVSVPLFWQVALGYKTGQQQTAVLLRITSSVESHCFNAWPFHKIKETNTSNSWKKVNWPNCTVCFHQNILPGVMKSVIQ